jgi:TonB family protein
MSRAMTRVESPFGPTREDAAHLTRAIRWSLGVHVLLVIALLVVPRSWLTREPEKRNVMTISLGGTPGPRTTGTTSIGSRTVEQAAPPPKRPEPVRPTPERPPAPVVTAKPIQKPAATPKPVETPVAQAPAATRPPVTGAQVNQGNTAVDTGARSGQGAGLTQGGGGFGGETDLKDFCCPLYLQTILGTIEARWNKNPADADRGETKLKFTISRDGSIENIIIEKGSGSSLLDRNSLAAVIGLKLPPLPAEYTNPTLTMHLRFPYGQ